MEEGVLTEEKLRKAFEPHPPQGKYYYCLNAKIWATALALGWTAEQLENMGFVKSDYIKPLTEDKIPDHQKEG